MNKLGLSAARLATWLSANSCSSSGVGTGDTNRTDLCVVTLIGRGAAFRDLRRFSPPPGFNDPPDPPPPPLPLPDPPLPAPDSPALGNPNRLLVGRLSTSSPIVRLCSRINSNVRVYVLPRSSPKQGEMLLALSDRYETSAAAARSAVAAPVSMEVRMRRSSGRRRLEEAKERTLARAAESW